MPRSSPARASPRQRRQLAPADAAKIDDSWAGLSTDKPPLRDVLSSQAAFKLNAIKTKDPRIKEILIADRFGQSGEPAGA